MLTQEGGASEGHTSRDTLDTTSARETADSGLGDTLNVVLQNLAMTLGTALAEALAALSACRSQVSIWNEATAPTRREPAGPRSSTRMTMPSREGINK